MLLYLRRALPILLLLTVAWLSHQSVLPAGMGLPAPWDKVAHGCGFFVLGLAVALGWADRAPMWLLFALLALYGATDEVHQSFVPGRDASIGDWLADLLGSGLGLLAWCGVRQWFPFRIREAA